MEDGALYTRPQLVTASLRGRRGGVGVRLLLLLAFGVWLMLLLGPEDVSHHILGHENIDNIDYFKIGAAMLRKTQFTREMIW